jgi:hypothetical protein
LLSNLTILSIPGININTLMHLNSIHLIYLNHVRNDKNVDDKYNLKCTR